jgi:hypothetical protein
MTDQTYGRLTARWPVGRRSGGILWLWSCVCGSLRILCSSDVTTGNSTSCGCARKESCMTHGLYGTPEYRAFQGAKQRCTNQNSGEWAHYGGRGIEFRFKSFEQFFAELGRRPSTKHSVDRFPNNDGHYEPGNVRWATRVQQRNNRRTPKKYRVAGASA